jgi:uncharacterized membrane protein YqjE
MWKSLIKFLAVLWLKNRMEFIRSNFFNKLNTNSNDDLTKLKETIAVLAESRAAIFKQNFNHEINRVVNSLFGFMLILLAAILSLLTGLAWLFAVAWNSPNRDLILGSTVLLPILVAVVVYFYIRQSWQKQPLLQQSIWQVESDWQLFRNGFDGMSHKEKVQEADVQETARQFKDAG